VVATAVTRKDFGGERTRAKQKDIRPRVLLKDRPEITR